MRTLNWQSPLDLLAAKQGGAISFDNAEKKKSLFSEASGILARFVVNFILGEMYLRETEG